METTWGEAGPERETEVGGGRSEADLGKERGMPTAGERYVSRHGKRCLCQAVARHCRQPLASRGTARPSW